MVQPRGSFQRSPPPKAPSILRAPIGGPSATTLKGAWSSLARLLGSGVGVPDSLRMLAGDGKDALANAFRDAARRVEGGASLSDALAEQRGLVNAEEIQMIRASERVGDLAPVFEGISEEIGARVALRRALLSRTMYPSMVLVASAVITPLPMVVTGTAGAYLAAVGINLLTLVMLGPGTFFGVRALARVPAINRRLRRFAWLWPWGTGAYRDRVRARFARVLGRNIESGLPVYESLRTAADVTSDQRT
ncbi:MAG: type II secretion system F family protein, partial [Myxococcota bacterium]|nr:type II secretion system F family protein [Myxococcota bacterium]